MVDSDTVRGPAVKLAGMKNALGVIAGFPAFASSASSDTRRLAWQLQWGGASFPAMTVALEARLIQGLESGAAKEMTDADWDRVGRARDA